MSSQAMRRWAAIIGIVAAGLTTVGAFGRGTVAAVRQYDQVDVDSARIDHLTGKIDSVQMMLYRQSGQLDEVLRRLPAR